MTDTNPSEKEPTYGEKAVGLSFNPSGNEQVDAVKKAYASVIDLLHTIRMNQDGPNETARLASIAITEAQAAQMWAVKALTWKE